ncbi:MAG: bifunctional DNA primase/polymerase [Mycobacterium sp.]|nr:bifunctional DNA primase/polymerase [Mycobacterium sp.]
MVTPLIHGSPAHRADALTTVLRAHRETPDARSLIAYAHALAALGVHVVVVQPLSKRPTTDYRTDAERAADHAAGRTSAGWHLGTTDPQRLTDYITRAVEQTGQLPNLGMHLGPSGIVVVDADNEGDAVSWHQLHFDGELGAVKSAWDIWGPFTVLTPGQFDQRTQEWVHQFGAHCWYVGDTAGLRGLNEAQHTGAPIPAHEHRAGWEVKLGDGAGVMLPPAVRPEGRYRAAHRVMPMKGWLRDMLTPPPVAPVAPRAPRDAAFDVEVDETLDDVPWSDVMAGVAFPEGEDRDGCTVWTRPGGQPRSMVAHEGCESAHGSHIVTVHSDTILSMYPLLSDLSAKRGSKNFSKWEILAAFQHGGNLGEVARRYGFSRPRGDWSSVIVIPAAGGAPAVGAPALPMPACAHGSADPRTCVPCASAHRAAVLGGAA